MYYGLSSMRRGWMIIPPWPSSENLHREKKTKKNFGHLYCFSFPHSLETDWCDMTRLIVRCSGRPSECLVPLIVPWEISSSAPWDSPSGVQLSAQMGAGFAAETSTTAPPFFFYKWIEEVGGLYVLAQETPYRMYLVFFAVGMKQNVVGVKDNVFSPQPILDTGA